MTGKLNNTKLTFTKASWHIVEVVNVMFTDYDFDFICPVLLQFNWIEIKDSGLIGGKDNLDWVDVVSSVRVDLLGAILNKSASETVHDAMLSVTLFAEAK